MEFLTTWHPLMTFAAEHQAQCSKPVYVRAIVFYSQIVSRWFDKSVVVQFLGNLFPFLLGVKVLICVSCHTFEFSSWGAGKLFIGVKYLSYLLQESPSEMDLCFLYESADLRMVPEEDRVRVLGLDS